MFPQHLIAINSYVESPSWGFFVIHGFTITPVTRTAEMRSARSRQQTGKNGKKQPEKLPRSHPVNLNHMHRYAVMCITQELPARDS